MRSADCGEASALDEFESLSAKGIADLDACWRSAVLNDVPDVRVDVVLQLGGAQSTRLTHTSDCLVEYLAEFHDLVETPSEDRCGVLID
jgi:hypothetical protein